MFSNAWVKPSRRILFPKPGNYIFFCYQDTRLQTSPCTKGSQKSIYTSNLNFRERDRVYARACRLYVKAAASLIKHSFVVRSEPVPPKPSVRRHLDSCDGHRMCSTHPPQLGVRSTEVKDVFQVSIY